METKPSSVWLVTGTSLSTDNMPCGKRIVDSSLARGDRVIATGRYGDD